MTSVRMLAAGAAALFVLPILTAPVRADCDDRFIKKCETESEAAFTAEQGATTPQTRRKPRAHVVVERPATQRTRAPRFIARTRPAVPDMAPTLASDESRPVAAPASTLARRFQGFIDPLPMTLNAFEALRKPRPDAEHLAPAATLPAEDAVAGPDENVMVADLSAPAAPAEQIPQAAAAPPAAADAATPAPVFAQMAEPASDDGTPGGFPFHKLVLTLCGALGVASALRFIVRA